MGQIPLAFGGNSRGIPGRAIHRPPTNRYFQSALKDVELLQVNIRSPQTYTMLKASLPELPKANSVL
jgi:hypothetical protein